MKILISVVGRFHAFDLALQLKKHKLLHRLNSTYPIFEMKKWGFQKDEVNSNILLEIINRYFNKFVNNDIIKKIVYKRHALSNLKFLNDADVIITWSGASLEILKLAKEKRKISILERGSSHYSYQMKILSEEYALYGKKYIPDKWVWDRELLEYELADYISIPSTFVKNTFVDFGISEKKLLVNPYGVDLSSFRKINKTDEVFRIITSGNLSIQKGTKYLLEAFDQLNLDNSEIWHIGSINEDMKEWLLTYKNKNVHFLGHKPQNELYKYYSQGSVFCLMSLQEGLAMVQPQAMACGLPILITTNTGGSDLISEEGCEGYVINIRDTERLKEILKYLYNNPTVLNKMSSAALNRVKTGFTWDDYGSRYVESLNKINKNN